MINQNNNRVWELEGLLGMFINDPAKQNEFLFELKRIVDLDPKQLETLIKKGRNISSMQELQDNIAIFLEFSTKQTIKNVNTLAYLLQLTSFEILKNNKPAFCDSAWFTNNHQVLATNFKKITEVIDQEQLKALKLITDSFAKLKKINEPGNALKYHAFLIALMVPIIAYCH